MNVIEAINMNAAREDTFEAVERERGYQLDKWGNKPLTIMEWLVIMESELTEAKIAWLKAETSDSALQEILQAVVVGVACLEQHGIVERDELIDDVPF